MSMKNKCNGGSILYNESLRSWYVYIHKHKRVFEGLIKYA